MVVYKIVNAMNLYSRYLNEELRHSTKFTFKLLSTKMVSSGNGEGSHDDKQIDHQRGMTMRRNSVRGAIRKSSRSYSKMSSANSGENNSSKILEFSVPS